jgi:hypothetical protein
MRRATQSRFNSWVVRRAGAFAPVRQDRIRVPLFRRHRRDYNQRGAAEGTSLIDLITPFQKPTRRRDRQVAKHEPQASLADRHTLLTRSVRPQQFPALAQLDDELSQWE